MIPEYKVYRSHITGNDQMLTALDVIGSEPVHVFKYLNVFSGRSAVRRLCLSGDIPQGVALLNLNAFIICMCVMI